MDIVLLAVSGLLVGWLLNVLSDYLPRFAGVPPTTPNSLPALALFHLLDRRYYHQPWFKLHLAVELLTTAYFAWVGLYLKSSGQVLWLLAGYSFFMLIALIDIKYRLILNIVTYPAIVAVMVLQLLILQNDPRSVLLGGLLAFSVFFLVAWLKPGQLGGGDVKLAALIGLTFGFPGVLVALLVGAGAGGIAAVVLLARHASLKQQIPYAPFLCFGALAVLLYYSLQVGL